MTNMVNPQNATTVFYQKDGQDKSSVVRQPLMESPVEYPSEFYGKTPGKLKHILYRLLGQTDNEELTTGEALDYFSTNKGKFQIREVCALLTLAMKTIQGELRPFKGNLGTEGNPLGSLDLMQASPPVDLLVEKVRSSQTVTLKQMLFQLLIPYRMGTTNSVGMGDYSDKVFTNIMILAKQEPIGLPQPELVFKSNYNDWCRDIEFCKLIASLDMFLVEFQGHELAPCRINTLPSRYKDCSALSSLILIGKSLGTPLAGTMAYAFDGQVIKELEKFLRTTEELELRDLNLSAKSPYLMVT